jgi:hypothetical protein
MITCDVFELVLNVESDGDLFIEYSFYTDLPAGTRVTLSCQRMFANMRDEECLWVGYNEAKMVEPSVHGDYNGGSGRIDVIESDKKALALFKQINKGLSAGIKTPIGDDFTVVLTVGARQRLREFGRNNCNLSGQMVSETGGINVVEVSKSIKLPMLAELQPLLP